jgi:hypothetical protein
VANEVDENRAGFAKRSCNLRIGWLSSAQPTVNGSVEEWSRAAVEFSEGQERHNRQANLTAQVGLGRGHVSPPALASAVARFSMDLPDSSRVRCVVAVVSGRTG